MGIPVFAGEISFRFSRSGGAGGQNVNKVESAATGSWQPQASEHFTHAQKAQIQQRLHHRLAADGWLHIRSQVHRTQLANRDEVLRRFDDLVARALVNKKARIATKPTKAAKEKRLQNKKQRSVVKQYRNTKNWEE